LKGLRRLFQGLRGKLTLTYTLVTVLTLLSLEVLMMVCLTLFSSLNNDDQRAYLDDVVSTLSPQARAYLQPGDLDQPGLQAWLEQVYASGYASLEPTYAFDSPAARIVRAEPMYVLSPQGIVLAQAPGGQNDLAGRSYVPPAGGQAILEAALAGERNPLELVAPAPQGNYRMAIPVRAAAESESAVVGVILLTIAPSPPMILFTWPTLLFGVVLTGLLLLAAVMPLGALFGFIMSRPLARRLKALTAAADAWSEGNFQTAPLDRGKDEIGYLSLRLRHMAERLQGLLQSQQELATLEERNRLARDLHDTVKQHIFATQMQVRAARNLLEKDPQAAGRHLETAEELIRSAQQELGHTISELRPAALDGKGLAEAVDEYLQNWSQRTHIPAELQLQNQRSLPLTSEQPLFRILQEALANVARHSRASAVTVRLVYEPDQVCLTIADNGAGFDPQAGMGSGFGLRSMQERAQALGGQFYLESSPESGTLIRVTAPARPVNTGG
jgi:NarL family two-component system sensor histidine kinase LiaS